MISTLSIVARQEKCIGIIKKIYILEKLDWMPSDLKFRKTRNLNKTISTDLNTKAMNVLTIY